MDLVIVESPNKCSSIEDYLGDNFKVMASVGHIMDLPPKELGIDLETWKPQWEFTDSGAKAISKLRKAAQDADTIYIATDLDREGEAIAAHLYWSLKKITTNIKRVIFNEITKDAVTRAIKNPGEINWPVVEAQGARRCLDRLVGWYISPVLSNACGEKMSAGRVQSVGVRLLVDREREIQAFQSVEHYGFAVTLDDGQTVELDRAPFVTEDNPYIIDQDWFESFKLLDTLAVASFEEKPAKRMPPAPFITSTLQQAAANSLSMRPKQTMNAAQLLFELGLITYHRTDFPNLSVTGCEMAYTQLNEMGFENDLPDKPNKFKVKGDAQEAHEAIRPTDFSVEKPEHNKLTKEAIEVYELIRTTALASQMKAEELVKRKVVFDGDIRIDDLTPQFTATSQQQSYPGWKSLLAKDATEEDTEQEKGTVKNYSLGDKRQKASVNYKTNKTKAPSRYSEASLNKKLEAEGIGRPATYASISEVITSRFANTKGKFLFPNKQAIKKVEILQGKADFLEIGYTRSVEETLDQIASSRFSDAELVESVESSLSVLRQKVAKVQLESGVLCPQDKFPMRRIGKPGKPAFWVCSSFPDCKYTMHDLDGESLDWRSNSVECASCDDGHMVRINTANGAFWGCGNYQNGCQHKMDDEGGKPVERKVYRCPVPDCEGELFKCENKTKGFGWPCNSYKETGCNYYAPDIKGQPQAYHPCPEPNCCGHLIQGTKMNSRAKNWYCSSYRGGCKFTCDNKNGGPILPN